MTAISLKNQKELDKDIQRIEDRHASGELSDESYKDLQEIIKKAQRRGLGRGRETGV